MMNSMEWCIFTHRLIDGIIYNCQMISFTINLEAMSRSGAKRDETFRGSNEMHRSVTVSAKTNGSKTSSLSEKIGNITSTS